MSRFWGLAALVVGGIIIADLVIHGSQTTQVVGAGSQLEGQVGNQLLGSTVPASSKG